MHCFRQLRYVGFGFLFVVSLSLIGCVGSVSAREQGIGPEGGKAPPAVQPPPGAQYLFACEAPESRGRGNTKMRRMTKPQLINTLEALLGSEVMQHAEVLPQLGLFAQDTISDSVSELADSPSGAQFAAMLAISTTAAELALSNPTLRNRLFTQCGAAAQPSDDCVSSFIRSFGLRAFRRPVNEAETAVLLAYFKQTGGPEGLKRLLMRMLLAPELAYHIELGTRLENGRRRLSDYEVAARISYRVASTLPDAELLAAAARPGELQSLDNVRTHVERLLRTNAEAKANITDFFRYYLSLDFAAPPTPLAHRDIDVTGLKEEMTTELNEFVHHIVWSGGTFRDLLLSRNAFPRSDRMARILDTSKTAGDRPSQTSLSHGGLLLRPALLAQSSSRTNPLHRGALVRRRIFCTQLGAPDPAAIAARMEQTGDLSQLPNRERYATLTSAPQCQGCHALVNPSGFVFEGYDQLGMVRTEEVTVNGERYPLETAVQDPALTNASGTKSFANAVEYIEAMSRSDVVRACFAETLFEFQGKRTNVVEDSCAVRDLEHASTPLGSLLDAFIVSVANEDIFWRAL